MKLHNSHEVEFFLAFQNRLKELAEKAPPIYNTLAAPNLPTSELGVDEGCLLFTLSFMSEETGYGHKFIVRFLPNFDAENQRFVLTLTKHGDMMKERSTLVKVPLQWEYSYPCDATAPTDTGLILALAAYRWLIDHECPSVEWFDEQLETLTGRASTKENHEA